MEFTKGIFKMNADEKIEKIKETLESGYTLYFRTHLKIIKVTPTTYKKWIKEGLVMFKVVNNSMYMARGNKFDCIDYCHITMEK
jgi:phage antirepressor YoqD-like protein